MLPRDGYRHYSVTLDRVTGEHEAECDCGWYRRYPTERQATKSAEAHAADCYLVRGGRPEWGLDLEG